MMLGPAAAGAASIYDGARGRSPSISTPNRKALRTLVAEYFGFDLPELETIKVDGVPDWK